MEAQIFPLLILQLKDPLEVVCSYFIDVENEIQKVQVISFSKVILGVRSRAESRTHIFILLCSFHIAKVNLCNIIFFIV